MATLANGQRWTTNPPAIYFDLTYTSTRSGQNMTYNISFSIRPLQLPSHFGYPIYLTITGGGSAICTAKRLKTYATETWASAISYSASFTKAATSGTVPLTVRLYSGEGSTRDVTYTYALPIIPAASELTAPATIKAGTAASLTISRKSADAARHIIKATAAGHTATIYDAAPSGDSTTASWTPALADWAPYITTARTAALTLTLTTYNAAGDTMGSSTATATLDISSDALAPQPTLSYTQTPAATVSHFGGGVEGKTSTAVTVSPGLQYGATVASVQLTNGGRPVSTLTATFTDKTAQLVALITDSRGYQGIARQGADYVVRTYSAPTCERLDVYRAKQDGTPDEAGTYLGYSVKAAIAPAGNINSKSFKLQARIAGSSDSWQDMASYSAGYTWEATSVSTAQVDADNPYDVRLVIADWFGSVVVERSIETTYTLLDFYSSGHGLRIGGAAYRDGVEVSAGVPVYLMGSQLTDVPVAQGYDADSGWYYRQYSSGFTELWGKFTDTPETYTKTGSNVYSDMMYHDLPYAVYNGVLAALNGNQMAWLGSANVSQTQAYYRIMRSVAPTAGASFNIYLHVIGSWLPTISSSGILTTDAAALQYDDGDGVAY